MALCSSFPRYTQNCVTNARHWVSVYFENKTRLGLKPQEHTGAVLYGAGRIVPLVAREVPDDIITRAVWFTGWLCWIGEARHARCAGWQDTYLCFTTGQRSLSNQSIHVISVSYFVVYLFQHRKDDNVNVQCLKISNDINRICLDLIFLILFLQCD